MITAEAGQTGAVQATDAIAAGLPQPVVAVFDLDGTLTRGDTFVRYLLAHLWRRPWRLLRCWLLPFEVVRFNATGRQGNERLKTQFLTAVLGGMSEAELAPVTGRFVDRVLRDGLRPGAQQTLRRHRDAGHELVLLTASPDLYVHTLAERLGFHKVISTRVEWNKMGRLTGRLEGSNCRGREKLRRLQEGLKEKRKYYFSVAYADEPADTPVLSWADIGVSTLR